MRIQINGGEPAILEQDNISAEDEQRLAQKAKRNGKLATSDLMAVSDRPDIDKTAWGTYRQELRDMDFSDVNNITWPTRP